MNIGDLFEKGEAQPADSLESIIEDADAAEDAEEATEESEGQARAHRKDMLSSVRSEMEFMEVEIGASTSSPDATYLVDFAKDLGIEDKREFVPWLRTVAQLARRSGYATHGMGGVAAYLREAHADAHPPARRQ